MHCPFELQRDAAVSVALLAQAAALQTVLRAYFAQRPVPSHSPVVPQVAAVSSLHTFCGSLTPVGTGRQVPTNPTSVQETHAVSHFSLQHTPFVQKPLLHSAGVEQVAPSYFFPQLLFVQTRPGTQSVSVLEQRVRHLGGELEVSQL